MSINYFLLFCRALNVRPVLRRLIKNRAFLYVELPSGKIVRSAIRTELFVVRSLNIFLSE